MKYLRHGTAWVLMVIGDLSMWAASNCFMLALRLMQGGGPVEVRDEEALASLATSRYVDRLN